jgi:hypothetical protein
MKQISTTTAILLVINAFGDSPFSIWDITKSIREDVRNGEYELRYEHNNVGHDMVKDYFLELVDNGLLDDFYVRNNPNGYREFSRNIPNVIPKTTTPKTTTPDPTAVVQNAMNTTVLPKDVQLKIYTYLKNNGPSSMKKIQSRLKGYPYTCQEIKEFLDKINLIDPQSSAYSTSQAFTVRI